MTRGFVLYDDALARAAEPFALTRPFGELRAGALLIRERWERALGAAATGAIVAPHLASFDEFGAPSATTETLKAGTVIVNSRFAPALGSRVPAIARGETLVCDGLVAAVALAAVLPIASLADGAAELGTLGSAKPAREIAGWWHSAGWDLVKTLPEMLAADAAVLASNFEGDPPPQVSVLGAHRFVLAPGAYAEAHVVADTTAGDIVVLQGARIGAFVRIAGPAVIGAHTQVAGGRYGCVSVGEHSRVCGEMSVVIVTGHSNKAHDGFVGHSVLGRWANLGAGTTTSNLKNSYGPVRVQDSRGEHETEMQFLGSLVGDHAKTAIGTRLMTGTIVGAGANVFGDRSPEKFVPPFAWGDRLPFERYQLDKFLEVAAHVMKRREVLMSAGMRDALAAAWEESYGLRSAVRDAKAASASAAVKRSRK